MGRVCPLAVTTTATDTLMVLLLDALTLTLRDPEGSSVVVGVIEKKTGVWFMFAIHSLSRQDCWTKGRTDWTNCFPSSCFSWGWVWALWVFAGMTMPLVRRIRLIIEYFAITLLRQKLASGWEAHHRVGGHWHPSLPDVKNLHDEVFSVTKGWLPPFVKRKFWLFGVVASL